ncbi:MAG TPA: spore coat U domain-containing protein [Luteimonas sp.]|nr:spore coat U domain-containing protein [Luteimonas sp.]
MNLKSTLLATALLAAGAAPAFAATGFVDFNVNITIVKACNVSAVTDVAFGSSVASTAVNTDAIGGLSVTCTLLTPYTVSLNNGLTGTSVSNREMKDAGATYFVPYQLYQDLLHTSVWGSTVGTNTLAGTGTGLAVPVPVYGRVPSANFPAGTYSDVVRATITY